MTLVVMPYFVLALTEAVANPRARAAHVVAGSCLLVAFAAVCRADRAICSVTVRDD